MSKETEIKNVESAIEYEKKNRNDKELIADMEKYVKELKEAKWKR